MNNGVIVSPLLPGGDLIAAVLDREVMGLADRGGASGLIGERWADLCAIYASRWVGQPRPIPMSDGQRLAVDRIIRLDAIPAVAAAASKRAMQNPDLLFIGRVGDRPAIQAADAKFSVETARSKQVSPGVVEALMGLGTVLTSLIGDLEDGLQAVPGVFLCPDYPLTHLIFRRRLGIVRATVSPKEVVILPAPADRFFAPVEGASVMPALAMVDALPVELGESLLASLYYFRLARSAFGCWLDANKPLLLLHDKIEVDEAAVREEAIARGRDATSAYGLILDWWADVQSVRAARSAVDQVTALPIINRDLRTRVFALAEARGVEPPSLNSIRRKLGVWYRGQFRERVGPLFPPVANLGDTLSELATIGASLQPALETEIDRVIDESLAEQPAVDEAVASQRM